MESPITLSAATKNELNKLIDEKLKEGYLITGVMQADESGEIKQVMSQPNNIDGEITLPGAIKLLVGIIVYVLAFYFFV